MAKETVAPKKPNDALAGAMATLRAIEARVAEADKPVRKIQAAMDAARVPVNERAAVEQIIVELQEQRRRLISDKFLNGTDSAELEENTAALSAAEKQLGELGRAAADALIGISVLEQSYATAAQALNEAGAGLPGTRAAVLIAAAEPLMEAYGEQICASYDLLLEAVCLVGLINPHARAGKLQQVYPEIPPVFSFPGITLCDYQIENKISANQSDMQKARARLAKRLAELGVAV